MHYDVFTRVPFTGNQLAVFLDGRDLEPSMMQAIAREMAFSETTFILPAEERGTDVRMRIFTPGAELPMAGHPTIGSTFALAQSGVIVPGRPSITFGLGVGPTPVALEWKNEHLRFAWMTQKPPEFGPIVADTQAVAAALGVRRDDIAGELPIQQVSCGVPFLFVPMHTRAGVDRALQLAGASEPDLGLDRAAVGVEHLARALARRIAFAADEMVDVTQHGSGPVYLWEIAAPLDPRPRKCQLAEAERRVPCVSWPCFPACC